MNQRSNFSSESPAKKRQKHRRGGVCPRRQVAAMARQGLGKAGFTLIEVIIIIVLVGIFMAAIATPFVSGVRKSRLPEVAAAAHFLAVEEMERLAGLDYDRLSSEDTGGSALPVSGYSDYTREVDVMEVSAADLSTPQPGSGYSKITVTVFHNDLPAAGISVVSLRTDF